MRVNPGAGRAALPYGPRMGDYQDDHQEPAIRSGRGRITTAFVAGAILLVGGLAGLAVAIAADADWQPAGVVSTSIAAGIGVLLLLLGVIAMVRRGRRSA